MAEPVVSFLLTKLDQLLTEEVQLLSGVSNDVRWINDELRSIKAFLNDADNVRETNTSVNAWVEQVQDVAYDAEDVLDTFIIQIARLQRRRGFMCRPCSCIKELYIKHNVATKIKTIRSRVDDIANRRERLDLRMREEGSSSSVSASTSAYLQAISDLVEEVDIVGVENKVELIEGWLQEPQLQVISIYGMGGLGKTTLAKRIYNGEIVKNHFHCRAWVTVSHSSTAKKILTTILRGFLKDDKETFKGAEEMEDRDLHEKLHTCVSGKKYIVVLDDVWDEDAWKVVHSSLPNVQNEGRFIITTRKGDIAFPIHVMSRVYRLGRLSEYDAWSLFCKKAFWMEDGQACPSELEREARLIVQECDGLPLAIVVIGGMMSKQPRTISSWVNAYRSLGWELSNHEGLRAVLALSYKDLPPFLRHCFLYCCLFPEDYEIPRSKLIRLWVSEGFIERRQGMKEEEVAGIYFRELLDRSLIHVEEIGETGQVKLCRVHDVVRKLGHSLFEKENFGAYSVATSSKLGDRCRRVSVQNAEPCVPIEAKMSHLRTFFMFGIRASSPSYLSDLFSKSRYMRVLDLEGIYIEHLPDEIGYLIHLRYIGLRYTGIKEVPRSLAKLRSLQTLDLEGFHGELPSGISEVDTLIYLSASHKLFRNGLRVPNEIIRLTNLQILKFIRADSNIAKDLGNLTLLTKLYVQLQSSEDGEKLCESIKRMQSLRKLHVSSLGIHSLLQIETLEPPHDTLQKLRLGGPLAGGKLPNCIASLLCLMRLTLYQTKLSQDPFVILQTLPNLTFISLHTESYVGRSIAKCSAGGFPKLYGLQLGHLNELEEWEEVEKGGMPFLFSLQIKDCKNLRSLPHGFQHLTTLKFLDIVDMSPEFLEQLQYPGKDYDKVRHIPFIWIRKQ
ncbi:disease resistance protein RPM1-like [Amborella trichopoda]|uniref:AAA+ ATPase domain-containing protein n=1 Tax=Amborella trichopoda TaxID=13333 RepID=W1PHD4_AMBTC|nr:disease resistance protein RPM1-like [Amborella trichopoda]ERN06525.1 hypothetical protein AMTR_s00058p00097500 [Amborella trichopoda]|eukprot:XP_006844850.3 disease resistance protein RPM1-like [Amborella trichopoda]